MTTNAFFCLIVTFTCMAFNVFLSKFVLEANTLEEPAFTSLNYVYVQFKPPLYREVDFIMP